MRRAVTFTALTSLGSLIFLLPATPISTSAQTCVQAPSGIVSWWSGDCDAGDIHGVNEGAFVNGATLGPGFVAQGFTLDGVNDYINVGDQNSLDFGGSTDFTIEAWIKTFGTPHVQGIVDKRAVGDNRGYLVSLTSAGQVLVFMGDGSVIAQNVSAAAGLDDGAFHHVAVVFDRDAQATIYVDGVADIAINISSVGDVSNAGTFSIGRGNINNPPSAHQAFQGTIDELRVFNRILTASEIASVFAASSAGICKWPAAIEPVVPSGFEVAAFGQNTDPCRGLFHISFDADENLFSGGTKTGDDTGALSILRFSTDGMTVSPYGPPIADPDAVVVDKNGTVATSGPNSVLVGSLESIVQIDPTNLSTATLFSIAGGNIQQMAFDSVGRLFFADASSTGRIGRIENGTLSILSSLGVGIGGIAVDEQTNRIFVSAYLQGTVKSLAANGSLLNGSFVTGLSQPDALALDTHGTFGNDLYVAARTSGTIVRVDPVTGANEVFASNLSFPIGLTFDAAGKLYVADGRTIWRISALNGSVSGLVVADCPTAGTGLFGVTVDAFAVGTGDLVGSAVTEADGSYQIPDLPPAEYSINVVTPLGYTIDSNEMNVTLAPGATEEVDFAHNCAIITSNPRGSGYWKHQVGVATGGNGNAQIDAATLCTHLDLIEAHFNNNAVNQVAVYAPPPSGTCNDRLLVARDLLNLRGNVGDLARAKQQLMALLLNVAAGYISLTEVISADGATVSQAITFCDNLIDDPSGDHETAKSVAAAINDGDLVAAGVIPLDTDNIAYKGTASRPAVFSLAQNEPNPFNPRTTIRFTLPVASDYLLTVHDIAGRLVRSFTGTSSAGEASVVWDGRNQAGTRVGSGLYFYKVQAGTTFSDTKKMLLLK